MIGVVAGYVAFLIIGPTFSDFRYELMLILPLATGLALTAERVLNAPFLSRLPISRRLPTLPRQVP
jgi:hypothetical protein